MPSVVEIGKVALEEKSSKFFHYFGCSDYLPLTKGRMILKKLTCERYRQTLGQTERRKDR